MIERSDPIACTNYRFKERERASTNPEAEKRETHKPKGLWGRDNLGRSIEWCLTCPVAKEHGVSEPNAPNWMPCDHCSQDKSPAVFFSCVLESWRT